MNNRNNFTLSFEVWDFFGVWSLEFGASLELESWCLVLPTIAAL
jgi:hypothetical protein